jgi:hypothetical protein
MAIGGRNQPVGFAQGGGERLFHQYRNSQLERSEPHLRVCRRGDSNGHCFYPGEEIIHVHKRRGSEFRGNVRGPRGVDVAHSN